MDIVRVFGSNLKRYRTALGLSQEAFAEKCGLHRTYISALNVIGGVLPWKTFNVLRMRSK